MAAPLRVLISGYYGFGNTGDEAIALALTRELRRLGTEPTLLSRTPAQTAELYGCGASERMNPLALARAVAGTDVLLSGGGGLLQDGTSARTLRYYLGVVRLARMMGKRTVIFNQSVGPLSPAGRERVAAALRGLPVFVRDRASRDLLASLNVRAELGGDPALLLSPTSGIARDVSQVVIAPRGDVTEAAPALAEVTTRLQELGRRVVALSFMPEHDDAAARALGADEVISTTDPQRALDVIAASGFVIGVRLHAVILAAAAGVPFAGVSYDPKVRGFCEDAGAPVHPVSPAAPLLAEQAYNRQTPDWNAVEDMKLRAMGSFPLALGFGGYELNPDIRESEETA